MATTKQQQNNKTTTTTTTKEVTGSACSQRLLALKNLALHRKEAFLLFTS
jgi:hypothetical protein